MFNFLKSKKPVTIQYKDEAGNLVEKKINQRKLEKILKESGAKRYYPYKVLIKGMFIDGVKEADSTMFADDISKHVDEEGIAYANCHYENGEPVYTLMKKKMWEKLDEVEEITMDPNLSEEQRIEEIKKICL